MRSLTLCLAAALALVSAGCRSSAGPPSRGPIQVACARSGDVVQRLDAGPRARLAVVGDIGHDSYDLRGRTMAQLAAALDDHHREEPLDAIIVLGDNFYNCGLQTEGHWQILRPLARLGVPMFPVWGNHDYGLQRGCPPVDPCRQLQAEAPDWLRPLWRFAAPSYRIEVAGLAVVSMLDTTPLAMGWTSPPELQQRLRDDLAGAETPWRIAGGHHVLFSSGRHGIRREHLGPMRELRPTLRELGVHAFLSGHDHHLEMIRREGDPLWLISGSGSRGRSLIIPTAGSVVRANERGYAILDMTADRLMLTLHLLDGALLGEPAVIERTGAR
jgi:tartrate-resistant acid phosphatase type 5